MKKVVISGMGVVTPIGNDIDTFWASIRRARAASAR
jgi:3-oxoacyl-(acyl-carrier-protein) synthase